MAAAHGTAVQAVCLEETPGPAHCRPAYAWQAHSCEVGTWRSGAEALRHGYAGAHERYRALRSSFYVDVGGVIIVTDSADGRRCAQMSNPACKSGCC